MAVLNFIASISAPTFFTVLCSRRTRASFFSGTIYSSSAAKRSTKRLQPRTLVSDQGAAEE